MTPILAILLALLPVAPQAPQEPTTEREPLLAAPLRILPSPDETELEYRLIVKFRDSVKARATEDGLRSRSQDLSALRSWAEEEGVGFTPLIRMAEAKLAALQERAQRQSLRVQPDLAGMMKVHVPGTDPQRLIPIGEALEEDPHVEFVYIQTLGCPPPGDIAPPTPDLVPNQSYRPPNPGIDADYAWSVGAKGQGIRISDCEYGWVETHEDLEDIDLNLEEGQTIDPGVEANGWDEHGTAVIGETSAPDNGYGCSGIAPDSEVYTYPEWTIEEGFRRVTCITNAIERSRRGDIVLLEMQAVGAGGGYGPAELDPAVWIVVRVGTDAGVVVVGAAGNGNQNLDSGPYAEYRSRGDSGAILVGAGTPDISHDRLGFSTYGSRINVQGWGLSVFTLGYGAYAEYGGDDNQRYTHTFSGTSSASPFVAASCAVLQGHAQTHFGTLLSAWDLRAILIETGIPQGSGGHIGPLPDLRAALEAFSDLAFQYPQGLEDTVAPMGGTTIRVDITGVEEQPLAGSGRLHIDDGSGWQSFPMADLGSDMYDAVFPSLPTIECSGDISYYFSAETTTGSTITDPAQAPLETYHASAIDELELVISESFESPLGWEIEDENVIRGSWELGVPVGDGDRHDPPTDYDGSGKCFLTGNSDGNSDVDGGPTRLISPWYDVSNGDRVRISYARWIGSDDLGDDALTVEVAIEEGQWQLLESVTATTWWEVASFELGSAFTATGRLALRFSVADDPDNSVTEAAIDQLRIETYRCPLFFEAQPRSPSAGDFLSLTTWKGTPSAPALLFVTSINGTPSSLKLATGVFDPAGDWVLGFDVPSDPSLPGLQLGLTAFGLDAEGRPSSAPEVELTFQ